MPAQMQAPAPRVVSRKAGQSRLGLALAGGGPLGGIYEVGALLALADSLDGIDFNEARRVRRRVVGRLRRGRARQRHFAGADVPAVHRRRRRRRAQARDLPAPRVRRIRRSARRAAAARRATRAIPARPVPSRRRWNRSRHSRMRCPPACSTIARSMNSCAPVRRTRAHQRFPQAAPQALPRRDQPRHRRVGDVRRARARPRADLARDRGVRALPGLFPPVAIDGEHYVDGALNKTLHASVALDEGVDAAVLRQSARAVRRERRGARRHLHRREAERRADCRSCCRRRFARSSIRG